MAVGSKKQDYVRIFLLKDAPSSNPSDHAGTVVESYLRSGSKLGAREPSGSSTKDIDIKQLAAEQWFTVRYIVDIENGSFDAYVWDEAQQRFNPEKLGIGFRNDHAYVDHLLLGSGGGSGTHVLIDDVKIELIDNALSEIQVNGEALRDFDPDTLTYTYTLPFGTDPSAVPVVTATARDPYAAVEITQAADANGTASIEVTALNGDKQTYTVTFDIAGSVNDTVADILLDGVSFKGFDTNTKKYDIILPPNADIPEVTVTKETASDDVEITGTSTVTITVNSTGEYTLSFINADYELDEDFEGNDLPTGWTTAHNATGTPTGDVSVKGGALVLNDSDANSISHFAFGELAHAYTSNDLEGKQIVLEMDVNPSGSQQWIRAMFTNGVSYEKKDMAIEPYISAASKGDGSYTYRASASATSNSSFTPSLAGVITNGQWNHVKIEVSVDDGTFRITVTDPEGGIHSGISASDGVRANDGTATKFTHVHFGTGGGATGTVSYDNVKVYVCSDIS